jgi:chromosome segregation ATPase
MVNYLKTIIGLLPSLLTPLIGLIAVYIAYQQYQTNKRREKRESRQDQLSVYKRVKKFLNSVDTTADISNDAYNELIEAIAEADFLFNDEITDWLSELQNYADEFRNCEDHLIELKMKHKMITASTEKLRETEPEACANIEDVQQKMIDGLQNAHCELKEIFSHYLKVRN